MLYYRMPPPNNAEAVLIVNSGQDVVVFQSHFCFKRGLSLGDPVNLTDLALGQFIEVPPLKWSILRYGFSKEDHDGKKETYG